MTNLTPMLSELHRIFDALNEEYFNNELPLKIEMMAWQ